MVFGKKGRWEENVGHNDNDDALDFAMLTNISDLATKAGIRPSVLTTEGQVNKHP